MDNIKKYKKLGGAYEPGRITHSSAIHFLTVYFQQFRIPIVIKKTDMSK